MASFCKATAPARAPHLHPAGDEEIGKISLKLTVHDLFRGSLGKYGQTLMTALLDDALTLTILIGEEERHVTLSSEMIADAEHTLSRMDRDMDKGWQLGRRFIEHPGTIERCQIAADRLLTALHTQNEASMSLMSAYILSRLKDVQSVNLNTEGEADETLFYDHHHSLIS